MLKNWSLYLDMHQKLMGPFWAETHPPANFYEHVLRSLCAIPLKLTNQTNKQTQLS